MITINTERYIDVGLPDDFNKREDIIDKEQYKKDNCFFTIFNIVKDIFEKVYRLEVEILSVNNECKQQKIEVLSDVHTKEHKQFLLHCTGTERTWSNRKKHAVILDLSMSILDKEAIISNKIVEENNKKSYLGKVKLDFICKIEKKENPMQVQLVLINKNTARKLFKEFGHIVVGKIHKIITKTLMHMLQFKKHY
ncbi:hypothetical protein KPH14_004370 [Odynerus spinipes]|uniref:Uncharacterized protein n=1 Tax=Odynerus spinipes TaxID=1348599 RepID=A0AAD9RZ96_9HYME|nr:hypothetical protein KPH14_004370 [Odynerus spinipes]